MHHLSDFIHYASEDFAANESFQAFVFRKKPQDVQFWEGWIAQHPEKAAEVEQAVELLKMLAPTALAPSISQKEQELERLFASLGESGDTPVIQLRAEEKAPASPSGSTFLGSLYPYWRSVAAAVVGLLVLVGGFLYFDRLEEEPIVYSTLYGENATFILPDSSIVILNGNTRLTHAAGWDGSSTREVWVEGEAFFDVQHKGQAGNARFVVHTPGMDVEVLGTKFNVFNRDDKTNVVLTSGKVKVNITTQKDTSTLMMRPGETVEYFRKKETVVKKPVNAEVLTSWRNKVLVFEDTPLYKVGEIIEYTYGISVVFKDSMQAQQKLAGTIPSDNLDVLLTALAKSSNLSITRKDNQIVIENSLPLTDHDHN
jgi:transmembrane sensor